MEIINLFPGSFASNCYLLLANGEAAIVDPSATVATLLDELERHNARLRYILLTHGHFDHILTLDELRKRTHVPAYIHESDAEMLTDAQKNAFRYFFGTERIWHPCEHTFKDGDRLTLDGEEICVIHTPGHSRGSVCYLCNRQFLITGDTLFDGSFGRCDLWGGDMQALLASLSSLLSLDGALPIYPGHGGTATLHAALDTLKL